MLCPHQWVTRYPTVVKAFIIKMMLQVPVMLENGPDHRCRHCWQSLLQHWPRPLLSLHQNRGEKKKKVPFWHLTYASRCLHITPISTDLKLVLQNIFYYLTTCVPITSQKQRECFHFHFTFIFSTANMNTQYKLESLPNNSLIKRLVGSCFPLLLYL